MLTRMLNQTRIFIATLALLLCAPVALAQTTAFTYQGKLTDAGNPANVTYDLQFRLFDALVCGNQSGSTLVREEVVVSNGIFTVTLDFGAVAFPGANRWLEISVRPDVSTGAFTALSPLQPITATPYAVQSLNATNATNATSAINATNATNAVNFSGALAGDVTSTQGATTVARLQGRTVASTAPLGGQVLKFNSTTNRWEPDTDNVSGGGGGGRITGVTPGTGLSGGGASGNVTLNIANGGVGAAQLADNGVTDAKVVSVSGAKVTGTVTTATNATNATTAINATNAVNAMTATNATTAINFSGALAGDVTGNQGTTTVTRLRNLSLPTPVLADDGKVLRYKNDGVNPASFELAAVSGGGGTITGVTAVTHSEGWPKLENSEAEAALAPAQSGGSYNITQSVIPGGGGLSANGATNINGSVGQSAAAASK